MSLLSDAFLSQYDYRDVPWGFNGVGYLTYKRTYARTKDNGELEEWTDTIKRVIDGAQEIGAGYTVEEAERLYDYMFNLKGLFGGRFLWQLGTDTVKRYGKASLVNCWFVPINSIDSFAFTFDMLMLGGGVGFSVRRSDVNELPRIKRNVTVTHEATKDADFIVPDSREGWINLFRRLLEAYFKTGESFTYSTILIRGAGETIHGFGGKASGPLPLIQGMTQISEIFRSREGKKLRSVDALDIMNIVGSIVVAGNVRRSAEIALGDSDDILFLRAKNWSAGNIPNWRSMSNNTIYADSADYLTPEFWHGYEGNSEPYGLANITLAQTKGRLKDDDIIDNCEGFNPCAEISLSPYESCVLAELVLPRIESKQELFDIARLLYKTQKAAAALPSHWKQTNDIVSKNMRLGLGVTGILQALDKLDWLDEAYTQLRAFDKVWSKQQGWNESIKLATIKPSGTLSLLAGVTPGIHPALYHYYIRRIRMSSSDALVQVCKDKGYPVEYVKKFDGSLDYTTVVVSFPCEVPEGTITSNQLSAVEHLQLISRLQTIWADNAVSATVYYRPEELPYIQAWLAEHYEHEIKSVSFLLANNHGFEQAPYEEITEEEYHRLAESVEPLVSIEAGDMLEDDCATGACPIR
jgi:ribonucleoside-triphosphate reductase